LAAVKQRLKVFYLLYVCTFIGIYDLALQMINVSLFSGSDCHRPRKLLGSLVHSLTLQRVIADCASLSMTLLNNISIFVIATCTDVSHSSTFSLCMIAACADVLIFMWKEGKTL
jgi:hypothetical protein